LIHSRLGDHGAKLQKSTPLLALTLPCRRLLGQGCTLDNSIDISLFKGKQIQGVVAMSSDLQLQPDPEYQKKSWQRGELEGLQGLIQQEGWELLPMEWPDKDGALSDS
jgi:hypothetical protein